MACRDQGELRLLRFNPSLEQVGLIRLTHVE